MAKPVNAIVFAAVAGTIALASVVIPNMFDVAKKGETAAAPVKQRGGGATMTGGAASSASSSPVSSSIRPSEGNAANQAAVAQFLSKIGNGDLVGAEMLLNTSLANATPDVKTSLGEALTNAKNQAREIAAARDESARAAAAAQEAAAQAKEAARALRAAAKAETAATKARSTPAPARVVPSAAISSQIRVVYFTIGSNFVRAAEKQAINDAILYLKQHPKGTAKLSGFADPSGNLAANQSLARTRCQNVKAKLVSGGVAANRIQIGEARVLTDAVGSEEESADARRVEITLQTR